MNPLLKDFFNNILNQGITALSSFKWANLKSLRGVVLTLLFVYLGLVFMEWTGKTAEMGMTVLCLVYILTQGKEKGVNEVDSTDSVPVPPT